ncbi:MAG: hypothetical protein WBP58_17005 [Chitinophagaceae bacterium]
MRQYIALCFFLYLLPFPTWAQELFGSDSILQIKISGDLRSLMTDDGDNPSQHPIDIQYQDDKGSTLRLSIAARTRGNFRRTMGGCTYPPIMLLFHDSVKLAGTLFHQQKKLKLVMPCKGDQYVAKEYLAYRVYQLLTPMAFRARLVKLTLEDTRKNKTSEPFLAMLLEEEHQLATRNSMVSVEKKIGPRQAEVSAFHRMAVFEYFIGNTDWSVEYLQNVKLLAKDSNGIAYTVPYDFDHAGIVSPPYAKPAEQLQLSSVRERRYRGYCLTDLNLLKPFITEFLQARDKINSLYETASYLDASNKKTAVKFIDDFYRIIGDEEKWKKEFAYPCDKNGTGNVIISGMQKSNN